MLRLLRLATLVATAVMLVDTPPPSVRRASADPSSTGWDIQFCDSFSVGNVLATCATFSGSSTANGANPTSVARVRVQPSGGSPLEASPEYISVLSSPNLVTAQGPTDLSQADVGALAGEFKFTTQSNLAPAFAGSNNVNPSTGAPPACGASGTVAIDPIFPGFNSLITPTAVPTMTAQGFDFTKYVQSFDDDDNDLLDGLFGGDLNDGGDLLPETQGDDNGNMILDGVERMPHWIPFFLRENGVALRARRYGVWELVPGVIQSDVDQLELAVPVHAPFGGTEPLFHLPIPIPLPFMGSSWGVIGDSAASIQRVQTSLRHKLETLMICPPAAVDIAFYGRAADNPATPPCEGLPCAVGKVLRTLDNTKPGGPTLNNMLKLSRAEDYDNDGLPPGIDRCNTDPSVGTSDPDGDFVDGACDISGSSVDNCPGGGLCPIGGSGLSACTGPAAFGFEGGAASTSFPWDLDQDVDCDGWANFADNCPVVYNPDQIDQDSDTVGDACDPKPVLGNARSGVPTPANALPAGWISGAHDHDEVCDDPVTIGGAPEGDSSGTGFADMTCYAAGSGDSSDDTVQDYDPAIPDTVGGAGERDSNSDSDYDGVSDGEETDADGNCDGNPRLSDSNTANTLDGAQSIGPVTVTLTQSAPPTTGAVTYTGTSMAHASRGFVVGGLVGGTIDPAGANGPQAITANNATSVTVASWPSGTPAAGTAYTISKSLIVPCWRYDALQNSSASLNPNGGGSPDSDDDGCTNNEEAGNVDASGGNRDALWPYDFYNVPVPSTPTFSKTIVSVTGGGTTLNWSGAISPVPAAGTAYDVRATILGKGPFVAYTGTSMTDSLASFPGSVVGATIRIGGLGPNSSKFPRAVTLSDVGVVLAYVGRTQAANATYSADLNVDGLADGRHLDRKPAAGGFQSNPPDNAITLSDVGVANAQVGDSCQSAPN